MMIRYCKNCGEKLIFENENRDIYCLHCHTMRAWSDSIAGHTRDARINQLKAMHQLMLEANDEGIYMTWIYRMPDCPSEEDFVDIAMDDEQYNGCFDLFVKLIAKDGNRY